jgi:hypothetical protein
MARWRKYSWAAGFPAVIQMERIPGPHRAVDLLVCRDMVASVSPEIHNSFANSSYCLKVEGDFVGGWGRAFLAQETVERYWLEAWNLVDKFVSLEGDYPVEEACQAVGAYHVVVGAYHVACQAEVAYLAVVAYHVGVACQAVVAYHVEVACQVVVAYYVEVAYLAVVAYHVEVAYLAVVAYYVEVAYHVEVAFLAVVADHVEVACQAVVA